MSADYGYELERYPRQPLTEPAPPPPQRRRPTASVSEASWMARLRSNRAAEVRPGPAVAIALAALAGVVWLAVLAYGLDHLPIVWTLVAFGAGAAALALALRGYPIPGAVPLIGAVLAWGLSTRDIVPQSATDIVGDLLLFGWNLAFAAPLLLVFFGSLRVDSRRSARDQVRQVADDQLWRGERGENEPQLGDLAAIPSARFFALSGEICTHLVVAGRRVALIGATVWPKGDYTNEQTEVLRNGRFFGPGTDDVAALMADARTWTKRFAGSLVSCRAYLVVHPSSDRDDVRLALPTTDIAEILHGREFAEVVGEFLMREPYRIDVPVIQLLTSALRAGSTA
jgi:hypothetical protein